MQAVSLKFKTSYILISNQNIVNLCKKYKLAVKYFDEQDFFTCGLHMAEVETSNKDVITSNKNKQ